MTTQPNQSTGVVKTYGAGGKQYGFITDDRMKQDLFVHGGELRLCGIRALRPGDRVKYTIQCGALGTLRAIDIELLAA